MKWKSLCVVLALSAPLGALSGCSALGGKPQPPPNYKPVMPPGGYESMGSGMGARNQGGAPGTTSPGSTGR